jgi:hypothetical protein
MEEGPNKVVCKQKVAPQKGRDLPQLRQNSIRNEAVGYFSLVTVVLLVATGATNSAFLADFSLLDAVFSFHATLEGH